MATPSPRRPRLSDPRGVPYDGAMRLTVLGCSGSEAPGERTCSFRLGERAVLEMGCAAGVLPIEEQVRVDDVFLSHAHLDHVKDLAFFAENVYGRRDEPVHVHAAPATIDKIATHLLNGVVWPDFTRLPDAEHPTLRFVPMQRGEEVRVPGLTVDSVPVNHPGGCDALFFTSEIGTLVYSGDTGPTEALWQALRSRGPVRALLIETSFPNRLADLAEVSGHLTPHLLEGELARIGDMPLAVYVHHIKAPTRAETLAELEALGDERIRILEPGMVVEF